MNPNINRRQMLARGAAAGIGAAFLPTAVSTAVAAPSKNGRRSVSMAMHIHSCFSEGTASMDAHLQQTTDLGVEVIWRTGRAMRLQALAATPAWGELMYEGNAWNTTYTTSLAATVLDSTC